MVWGGTRAFASSARKMRENSNSIRVVRILPQFWVILSKKLPPPPLAQAP